MSKIQQTALFDRNGNITVDFNKHWTDEWKGMPEFIQKNREPFQKIVVNFENYDDVVEFANLLGFSVTIKTKSIWFPIREKDKPRKYAYVDGNK